MSPGARAARATRGALAALAVLLAAVAVPLAGCGGDDGGGDDAGAPCGVRGGTACPADQYCDFPRNSCGATDEPGQCRSRPASCPPLLVPERTCGCDGRVYGSACEAEAAGTDRNAAGACALDPGAFACGYRQCALANQYCERTISDVGGEPDGYGCLALPSCPGTPDCACLAGRPCGTQCSGDARGGLALTCLGG